VSESGCELASAGREPRQLLRAAAPPPFQPPLRRLLPWWLPFPGQAPALIRHLIRQQTFRCCLARPGLNLCGVLALIGCSHVHVQELGDGRYSLTVVTPSAGYAGSHEQAVDQADEYCARSSQSAVVESFDDKPTAGLEGQHATRVIFTCTASPAPRRF
jgi:hypothetical protein